MKDVKQHLSNLFQKSTGHQVERIEEIPPSGSDRRYYRLHGNHQHFIGAHNPNLTENQAFLYFTKQFSQKGIAVPNIIGEDLDNDIYLLEDLGNTTLLQALQTDRDGTTFNESIKSTYEQVVKDLAHLQLKGHEGLDYSYCYPTSDFNKRTIHWDCSYFKYYFLKPANINFNENKLEEDFERFAAYLNRCPNKAFMFRDFQARNVMLKDNKPYYIDYQGGRYGAIQYDLASILFQAKAQIPHEDRNDLLDIYINEVKKHTDINEASFRRYYYAYALVRSIQVLGAYGFRGIFERKPHFLTSIPYALKNIQWLFDNVKFRIKIPHLKSVLQELTQSAYFMNLDHKVTADKLTVTISSFSYRRGIPVDNSGNGGGHVFDCRAIHNPGRYAPYKKLTGRDQPVIDFLLEKSKIESFLANAKNIVDNSVQNYIERNFASLTVSFGCTGGQHRSVYSADQMAKHLKEQYDINIVLNHVEQEIKQWKN